jgi:hypothetical protein
MYDFAAPTSLITATDITAPFGYHSGANYYTLADNQCFAAPAVTAGVVAMMLEKNPYTYATDIRQELRDGVEKVGGYSYNANGVSVEFGHGRISCINSINAIPASSPEKKHAALELKMVNPIVDQVQIEVSGANPPQKYDGLIVDLHGNAIKAFRIPFGVSNIEIDMQNLAAGLYIVMVQGAKSGSWHGKLIKL